MFGIGWPVSQNGTLMKDPNPGLRIGLTAKRGPHMIEEHGFVRTEAPRSPLDPFLSQFLAAIDALPHGYLPTSDRKAVAQALGWQIDFAEAIMTSAQARGLVERVPVGHGRRRTIWRVSSRGKSWVEMAGIFSPEAFAPDPVVTGTEAML
jgi:hypothetical protein